MDFDITPIGSSITQAYALTIYRKRLTQVDFNLTDYSQVTSKLKPIPVRLKLLPKEASTLPE